MWLIPERVVLSPPPLERGCFCLSLTTTLKIFGFLSLVDCASVYVSTAFAFKTAITSCAAERVACAVVLSDVVVRSVHGVFVVLLLMTLYKSGSPRYVLWWVYSTLVVTLLTSLVMVPALDKITRSTQYIYYALSMWDLYACYVGYSYYLQATEGQLGGEESNN